MDERDGVAVDRMVSEWRSRVEPTDPGLRQSMHNDAWHAAALEHIRRLCHFYDRAMELEGIDADTRRRVLSMVLLGDPSGLEALERQRIESLLATASQYTTRPFEWSPS